MKVELVKEIDVYKLIFVGEVEFFKEDFPYKDLLKDFDTKDDLEKYLNKKLPQKAVENIIEKLEKLGVIKENDIVYKDIFPNREYGKYELLLYENDEKLPFKYKNKNIKRLKPTSKNEHNKIEANKDFINQVKDETNKEYRVRYIEKHKAIKEFFNKEELKIIYNERWQYKINEKMYEMDGIIDFDKIFDSWNSEKKRLQVKFDNLKKKNEEFVRNFYINTNFEKEIENYGKFVVKAYEVPVMPKDEEDAFKWLMFFLKEEIKNLDRYIDKDELEQIFYNLLDLDEYEVLSWYGLRFDVEKILKFLEKEDKKLYFLIKTPIDVYPFEESIGKKRIIIENLDDFRKFRKVESLIIVDRYVNTIRHFRKLEKILERLSFPEVILITQKVYRDSENKEIDEIIKKLGIKRVIKEKNEIPHSRWWIVNDNFYKTSDSLEQENTSFDLYDKDEAFKISKELKKILEELKWRE